MRKSVRLLATAPAEAEKEYRIFKNRIDRLGYFGWKKNHEVR